VTPSGNLDGREIEPQAIAKVGFEVPTMVPVLGRRPRKIATGVLGVTIFPKDRLPADHWIVQAYKGYFKLESGPA
jgi:hypothetical protein